MGILHTAIELSPWHDHARRHELRDAMVDTGREYTWISRAVLEELGVQPASGLS